MAFSENLLGELEPSIHSLIKKHMGFSEPNLLTTSLNCFQQGGNKDELTKRLSTLLEQRKASKLSDKICDAVDEFLLARDLPKLNHSNGSRKRSSNDQQGEAEDEPLSKMAKPDDIINMTPAQIRAMMANTMKQIQERKAALAGIRGNSGLSESTAKVSLPPPRVMNVVNAPSIHKTMDTAATIAALQARISNSLEKIGPIAPPPSVQQQQQQQPGILAAYDRPTAVILDDKGRTVDSTGQQITLTQHVPTLKANLRAKRNKDEIRDKEPSGAPQERDEVKFFDGRVAVKGVSRHKRTTFNFIEPGQYQREGQRLRMKAQLEKLQAEISTISRKTGITSATQLAKLVPKGDEKSATPDVEWWDALILSNGHSSQYDIKELREEAISKLVEHPIQLKPLEPAKHAHVPVFLTKKEQKKLRRQNRREAWSEKQDKIRLGILPPDQPKVKISNMMRVLESDAVQDPTKVEAHVRAQMAKRLANHEKMNSERKLTSDERKEKTLRKLKEDTSAGVRVSVYRVKNLSNPSKKFKVETNAKQLFMTGCVILYEDVNVVVVEGGPKQQKKYKQLMMNRIKWDEEFIKDKEGQELVNRCTLVWEGETKERHFVEFKFKQCPTESFAREFFKNAGVEHYWDQAYSGAVLENADIDI